MAANSLEVFDTAMHALERAESLVTNTRKELSKLAQENRQLQDDNAVWKSRAENIHKWQLWVMKNFPDLNPYETTPGEAVLDHEQKKTRQGLLNKLFGGKREA